ncbi:MAG: hypothetical protein AB7T49_06100 [Oligoflexales bacterium]
MGLLRKSLLLILGLLSSAPSWATVEVSGKHAIFVHPGLDQVAGNYVFLVRNASDSDQPAEIPLMLPKETVDWRVEQGADPSEIEAVDKKLIVRKNFPPGETFIAIGFLVDAGMGKATMTFDAPTDIEELAIYSKTGQGLKLTALSPIFQKTDPIEFSGSNYDSLSARGVKAAQSVAVELSGLPKGRKEYWMLGGAFMALLALIGGAAAWKTRPRIKETGDFA